VGWSGCAVVAMVRVEGRAGGGKRDKTGERGRNERKS
jgi:hypothetical protein